MTGEELLRKLELADPAYVQAAADAPPERRRPRLRRALLGAACVCLLASAAAAAGGGTWLLDSFTARGAPGSDLIQSGYDLAADVEKFPASALTGDIREAGEEIARQFENYDPTSSWYPGTLLRTHFPSAAEARAYIGLDALRGLDWDLEETRTALDVTGDPQGYLQRVQLETDYEVEGVQLQAFATVFTEDSDDTVVIGTRTTEDVAFSESLRTSAGGRRYQVITDTGLASGYYGMDGYLVEDGVLYSLHLAYLKEDEALAESLLCQWADLF
nr:hypothetical protein [uncultured Oscillibacter sp.]